ncbi:ribonuclease HII [Candidatus Woesearchaeota archaeon]|nr:ribonuclease HII [Candidatus Woesearchaeota archaeon]MBT5272781.1 ribonuclease HII [Candidatus Woesearchaeota archaeon]MBT6040393.1 ribonuclease HII [Candidatus Woesearchaeota archaeon]MBT6336974.1 ribonuclease HII [Candidatus Woesearchaeota archaeon]MBT7926860.1 ribonuclease HII [Candidatus Woesearchaeota archaeon]
MLIAGIDEAGRGPLIGPMVMVGVSIKDVDEALLKKVGVKDSKLLSQRQREEIYEQIEKLAKDYKIIKVEAKEVDEVLEGTKSNLNWLEADKTIEILAKLKPDKAYVDCPSINEKAYEEYLRKGLEKKGLKKMELVVEHKADVNYPVASAASIIAKVVREQEIEKIKIKINKNFGSGYPSDPYTQRFLEKYWDKFPEIFRRSWSSYKKLVEKKKQKSLGEF